jgi:hypothetical protein
MPVLDLSDCSRRFDAHFLLLAVMHAPRDAALRLRWEATAQQFKRAQSDDHRLVASGAWDALMREVRSKVRRRDGHHKADIAAIVLAHVLFARGNGTVKNALEDIARGGFGIKTGVSHATLEQAWSEFRSVAHIWAAFKGLGLIPDLEPLLVEEMLNMFSVAEVFRRKGMAHTTGSQQRPLLDPDETWTFRLPERVVLTPSEYVSSLPT